MIQTIRRLMSEMGLKPSNTFDQKPRLPLFFLALTGESTRPPSTIGSPSSSSCRSRAAFLAARRLPGRPRGAQRLMEPKQIMSPRGMEPTSVTTKSFKRLHKALVERGYYGLEHVREPLLSEPKAEGSHVLCFRPLFLGKLRGAHSWAMRAAETP